ncbi:MAG: hypothetical protein J5I52_04820 [Saprospiraceae bacterium]|nr:MAG: hypothetical protein UZ09_BCD002000622 [Bacteroidetes bacterium OLB9]MCO6463454.1 hypothetical protein [Saprospiraceae bacterium]MCZ2338805.1 hypothetical protein [Chitinophagales bacterium]
MRFGLRLSMGVIGLLLTISLSCRKENIVPNEADDMKAFWTSGEVDFYTGLYYSYDSIGGNCYIPDSMNHWQLDHANVEERKYWVKKVADTIYISFNPEALNTTSVLTPDRKNNDGWYEYGLADKIKLVKDTLYVKGDICIPPYVNGHIVKRHYHYYGIKSN